MKFLHELAESGSVTKAAKAADVARQTVYEWREADAAFAAAWDQAIEIATDALEEEARRRAKDGWEEPVFTKDGENCGTIRRYSDRLMEVLLRAHRPQKFREKVTVEHEIGEKLAERLENARRRDLPAIDVTPILPGGGE